MIKDTIIILEQTSRLEVITQEAQDFCSRAATVCVNIDSFFARNANAYEAHASKNQKNQPLWT